MSQIHAAEKLKEHINNQNMSLSDVPGDGACGFTSIAKAAFNACLHEPKKTKKLQKNLLDLYLAHHPQYKKYLNGSTDLDKLKELRNMHNPENEFYVKLGFAVRQLSVTKAESIGVFVSDERDENNMRKHSSYISEPYIMAAADALGININLLVSAKPDYAFSYESEQEPSIYLQLKNNNHYRPYMQKINNNDEYKYKPIQLLENKAVASEKEHIQETEQLIIADTLKIDKKEAVSYEVAHEMLNNLQLNNDELLELYQQSMPKCDYLQGRAKDMDKEFTEGSSFYKNLIHAQDPGQNYAGKIPTEDEIKAQLTHALARSVSIGHNGDLFEFISEHASSSPKLC